MASIEFHDPCGAVAAAQPHAPRIASLAGKRIGFLSNDTWQAPRTMPLLQALITADFPDAEVLAVDAFPRGSSAIPTEHTAKLVQASGVDAVVIGNAA